MTDFDSLSSKHVLRAAKKDKSLMFERAEGSRLWDIHGKMYLDTMSGSAGPAMVGHAHPSVVQAVARQMATLPSTNVLHLSTPVIEFCRRLAAITPSGLTKTFLCIVPAMAYVYVVFYGFRGCQTRRAYRPVVSL